MTSTDRDPLSVRFEPLRQASRSRLVVGFVLGPILWLVALVVAACLFHRSWAIALGLVVTAVSFVVSLLVLALLAAGRRRQEERYAHHR